MQIDVIMPSTPRVTNPSPAPSASSNSTKPGSFASILEEEQAATVPAEEASATEETEAATDSEDDSAEAGDATDASALVATLLGTQVAAAPATPVPTATVATEGDDSVELDPAAVVASAPAVVPEEAKAATTTTVEVTAPATEETAAVAPTAQPVIKSEPKVETGTAEAVAAPKTAETNAKSDTPKAEQASETVSAKPETAEAAPAPVEQKEQASATAKPAAPKPDEAASETLVAASDTRVTAATVGPTDEPRERATGKSGKENAAAVKGAQPATTKATQGAATATAVKAPEATADSTFRDALAAQSAKSESRSTEVDPAAEQPETARTDGRHTTVAVAHTEAPMQAEKAQAAGAAQSAGSAPAAVQDPGEVALKSIRIMTLQGEKQVTVKLKPESLGEMVISITTKDGGLDVQLTATHSATREILEKQIGTLRDTLSREGIVVNRVSVAADLSGQQQYQQAGNRQAGSDSGPARSYPMPGNSAYRNAAPAAMSAPRTAQHRGSLDLYA